MNRHQEGLDTQDQNIKTNAIPAEIIIMGPMVMMLINGKCK